MGVARTRTAVTRAPASVGSFRNQDEIGIARGANCRRVVCSRFTDLEAICLCGRVNPANAAEAQLAPHTDLVLLVSQGLVLEAHIVVKSLDSLDLDPSEVLQTARPRQRGGAAFNLCDEDLPVKARCAHHHRESSAAGGVRPSVQVDVLAVVAAAYFWHVRPSDRVGGEVTGVAATVFGGVANSTVYEVQPKHADVAGGLGQGVGAGPRGGGVGVRVARVHDVGEVLLEVRAGAIADEDCAAGAETLSTGA